MLSRVIVYWIIIGLPISIAVYMAMKTFILPYFKGKQTKNVNGTEVIPDHTDAQIDSLRQQMNSLINEIDQFVYQKGPSFRNILIEHDEEVMHLHQPSYMRKRNKNNENLFLNKFSQRIMNTLYFLRRRGIISQREWEDINRIAQPGHLNTNRILSLLKEYRLRLN